MEFKYPNQPPKLVDEEDPDLPKIRDNDQKIDKRRAIRHTIIYSFLFPYSLKMAFLSGMVFDNPRMTTRLGLSIIAFAFLVPLSIIVSIFLMWWKYLRSQYNVNSLIYTLPVITFFSAYLIAAFLSLFV